MTIKSRRTQIGDWIVALVCFLVILLCVLPMLNLLAQSLSSSQAVINGKVSFMPVIHHSEPLPEEEIEQDSEPETESFYTTDAEPYTYTDTEPLTYGYTDEPYVYEYAEEYDYYSDESNSYQDDMYSEYSDYDSNFTYQYDKDDEKVRNIYKHGITMESYRYVFLDPAFTRSMWWTAILTIICTIVSLTMTILCAYPLTYGWLRGKGLINTLIIFTMYFSAGTIPNYILMKTLGLLNNPLVLIIPNCLSVFNVIILRSFFFGIPDSLRESAEIDGANPFTVLIRIYLPLSAPVLATLALFYAVGRWNGFSDALLYLTTAPQWVPIQLKLWQLIQNMTSIDVSTVEMVSGNVPRASDAIKAAAIMFATVPILIVYPWLQRYFIAGVTIGAVKG
jgi:putative aldouronate transport system permease protein